jgi:ribosome-associated protein
MINQKKIRNIDFSNELGFKTSRSSGKGGQHVNKVETKVELRFNIDHSSILSDEEKQRVKIKLSNKINKEGILQITSEKESSQSMNKQETIEKFYALMEKALQKPKKRKPTKRSKKAEERRLKEKEIISKKKQQRKEDKL